MGCYWIGLAPIAYCAVTVVGYATLLCVSWANCHLERSWQFKYIFSIIINQNNIFKFVEKEEYKFPKISHIGAKQPELQFFAFVCMLQAISFALTTHYAYQVWRIVLLESRVSINVNQATCSCSVIFTRYLAVEGNLLLGNVLGDGVNLDRLLPSRPSFRFTLQWCRNLFHSRRRLLCHDDHCHALPPTKRQILW